MNRGVARGLTYFDDVDRVEFGRLLAVGSDRLGVRIHAYCLMPNHFHLLLECPDGGLSEYMQFVASVYTRHTNERIGRDGPLFRGRFRSLSVDDDHGLVRVARYIHRNPLALAGVDSPERYRWSSHRAYLGLRRCPPWLHPDGVLGLFGHDVGAFHTFVAADPLRPVPGSDGTAVDAGRVLSLVDLAIDEAGDELNRARQGLARTVALLVADRLGGALGAELIAELTPALGLANAPDHRRKALWRARQQASAHPLVEELVSRALQLAA